MATLHDSLMQSFTLRESGVELEISRGDDGVVMMQRVPDPVADEAALGVGAYRDPFALSEAAGAPVTESEVMGTAAGVLPGAAIGAVTAVPDIAGLIKGGLLAATAEEGQRIQQFLDGFSSISGVIGSERAFELYEAGVDALPVSDEAKQGMKQGAMVGEVLGFGTGATAAGKGVADYAAGAPQRLEDAQSGVTLGMGVDPTQVVDEAIVAGQKLMGKDPAPVPQAMPDAIDLTPEERSASLIDDLYDGETTIESGGNLYDVAKRINERSKSLGTRIDATPENQTKIAKVMAREALHAMKSKGNAGDWYREKVAGAMRIAERVYPEVAADPNKANAIKFITAITSNGASVPENSKNTFAVFDEYLKTGKMPDVGFGKETGAMEKAFELHNNLVDEMGETEFYDFMNQEFTVREIDEIGKKYGFKVSGEGKDTSLPASVIFGPKIGGGFYQNLQGNYKPLTMDRWFMRTWGRYTGGLIVEQTAEAAAKQMERIRKSVTPEIAAEYGYSFDDLVTDDTLLEELAYRAHKDYVKGGYKVKTELNKSSKNFVEAQKKVLEQPRTSKERNYMRSTVDEALDILRGQGVELDRAALQALIWYPEKELYAKLGIGTKKSAPTDYETEFATVAAERGFDVSDIVGNAQP